MLPIVMPSMLSPYSQDNPWTKKGSDAFIGQPTSVESFGLMAAENASDPFTMDVCLHWKTPLQLTAFFRVRP
jgi:hypothetical protein